MPKVPTYTLAWSPVAATYELHQTRNREMLKIIPDSPAWFAWLDQVPSFAFSGKSGHYTARKEAKQRGGRYWSAYLAMGEHLTKKYLGKTADLTLAQLEHIAGILRTQSPAQVPPPLSPAADADGEGEAARHPLLPQRPDPLNPFLATKLHIPRPRPHLVLRPHLTEQLQQGKERALTLVSAPAGFGKTTLLAQWLAECGTPAAWVSLGPEDNDPTSFLTYLIAALQTLDAQLGATALALLRTPKPPSPEAMLTVLTNDLAGREEGNFALVLDDYHVITAESIQRGMTFLLEHLPPQLHLILASRADPPLLLARLRAQGQLREIRTADLLTITNQLEAAEARLQEAERSAQKMPAEQARTIQGYLLAIRAAIASFSGDIMHGVSLARQALELLPETEVLPRAGALAVTIRAYLVSGDVIPAVEHEIAAAVAFIHTSDNVLSTVSSMTLLAHLHVLQGRLRQAAAAYAQVVQVVPRPEVVQTMFGSLFYYFGLCDLLRECNDLDAAERHLAKGPPMLALLRQAHVSSSVPGYVATLLSAFGEQQTQLSSRPSPLLEPLTKRECNVLRLLLEGASNREIARRLALSVNTVKRHVYNICGKLGVQSRTQAIIRARALNLL